MGHNDRIGWTLVTNRPDVADLWRVKFTDPQRPLAYEYAGDYRLAEEWTETIRVRKSQGLEDRKHLFRKTHHGPLVVREDDRTMLAAQVSGLFEAVPMRQALRMMRARRQEEFRTALAPMQMLFMNVIYADCDGNGVADACDLNSGTHLDCNLNGVPDVCELSGNDCDSNGVLDSCQPDCDHDGTPDACEIAAGAADVRQVIVDGRPVVLDGRHTGLDVAAELARHLTAVTG